MNHIFAAVCLLLISGCTMNNERKLSVDIVEVTENELKNVHMLLTQLNPKMSLQEFENNYNQVKDKEYKLYKATSPHCSAPVGLIGYIFNRDLCVGRAMYIDILVVDKDHRKRGIAKQLMDFAISKLHQDKNAHCIRWTTRNDLEEAINFYKNKIKAPIGYYYRIDNPYFEE